MTKTRDEWLVEPTTEPAEFVGDGVGIVSPGAVMAAEQVQGVEVRMVILRACRKCGGRTELVDGEAICPAGCGAATLHDCGVVDRQDRNPLKRALWRHIGKPLADRRIRRANTYHTRGR